MRAFTGWDERAMARLLSPGLLLLLVARAWMDPEYKNRLLRDASAAIAELGFSGLQGEDMVVVDYGSAYYELWLTAAEKLLTAKGIFLEQELRYNKEVAQASRR